MSVAVPKGYKQTKVGIIPADWGIARLGEITKINQGLQIPISERYLDEVENSYFYITNEFLKEGASKKYFIKNPPKSVLCDENDVLMTRTGNTGQIVTNVKGAFHNNFFKIKYLNKVNKNYLVYFLKMPRTQNIILGYAGASTIPDLNHGDFYRIKITLPPLKEQEKIAEILTTWDEAITKQEELIASKEEQKKALMQKLLSGEIRFKSFDEDWKFIKLGDLLDYEQPTQYLVSHTNYSDEYETPVLTAGKTFILGYTNETNGIFKDNLPVIIFDDFTTATKFVDFPFKVKSSAMKILKPKDKSVNAKLVYEIMQMINFVADDHKRYWISEYQELEIKLPSKDEQLKISEFLNTINNEINLLKNELEELKLQKKALMQKLLTGQVRVRV